MDFDEWFEQSAGFPPRAWQAALGTATRYESRLIRIPTGMGKTAGVLAAWTYHRVFRRDPAWPRRLVWCLPMRSLVEQTADVARDWLQRMREANVGAHDEHRRAVPVHVLMGGTSTEAWHLQPEHDAVLVGTQDMLLSRALNRGYGAPRGRWPMEFALLHKDCLWVLDEVQLMDVGLTTSVQLQAARELERAPADRMPPPARSWWMSATLQPEWLETRDFEAPARSLAAAMVGLTPPDSDAPVVRSPKPLNIHSLPAERDPACVDWAKLVAVEHREAPEGPFGRITLAIANTVDDAVAVFEALRAGLAREAGSGTSTELHLVHSRFRPIERRQWKGFLSREACRPGADRIIVSTQVIEAGVDLTASALVTQLAPWPSLVQRFGRAGRYGEATRITVVDRGLAGKSALPYEEEELTAALAALQKCEDASPAAIDALEQQLRAANNALLAQLYRHDPLHELSLRDFEDLFDTGADLTGLDVDVSRFIRSGADRDSLVWWWPCEGDDPPHSLQPGDQALCPVPAHRAREWLLRSGRLKEGCRAWVWDYLDGRWRRALDTDLRPGRTILVDASWGGYDAALGWTGQSVRASEPSIETAGTLAAPTPELLADLAQDTENLSEAPFKTIATHGREVAEEVLDLGKQLQLDDQVLGCLDLAARLHDYGKAHSAFQGAIERDRRPPTLANRNDLAKAPDRAWRRGVRIFGDRRGFRHELASTLGMFELLRSYDPFHPALLGGLRAYAEAGLLPGAVEAPAGPTERPEPSEIQRELGTLDAHAFDLVAYLVCAHHGKVRLGWQATPHDQDAARRDGTSPLRGVLEGDSLPAVDLASAGGAACTVPEVTLSLELAALGLSALYGASWRERTSRLTTHLGSTDLAYLETLLRAADVRASRRDTSDPVLEQSA